MTPVEKVAAYLRMSAQIADFLDDPGDAADAELRIEELTSEAVEELLLDPDADVSQYALDIAAILESGIAY